MDQTNTSAQAQINDGGPAFPVTVPEGYPYSGHQPCDGMTLRDYFAAKAVHGWLSSYGADSRHPADNGTAGEIARLSYEMADAMLAARGGAQ